MHEQEKLAEARYHLDRMKQLLDDRAAFNFEVRAFLTSARSVLQYAHAEIDQKRQGQRWYDSYIDHGRVLQTHTYLGTPEKQPGGPGPFDTTLLRFFRDVRNTEVHKAPLRPAARFTRSLLASVVTIASLSATVKRADGTTQEIPAAETPPPALPPMGPTLEATRYHFVELVDDPRGDDDVVTLCDLCVQALERFVAFGRQQKYITG